MVLLVLPTRVSNSGFIRRFRTGCWMPRSPLARTEGRSWSRMVLTSRLSFSGLKPSGGKHDIFYAREGEVAPPTEGIHEAYYWEMNHFPIRKCNRTEVS